MKIDNEEYFNRIINSKSKKICVIAGPGSGKTSKLLIPKAKQIINRINDHNRILILTFSRLSAIDLKNKIKKLEKIPKSSTIHSMCLAFLLSEDNHSIKNRISSIMLDFEKEFLISDLKIKFPDQKKIAIKRMLKEFSAGWAIDPHDEVFNENQERKNFKLEVINWLNENEATLMEEIVYFAVDLAKKLRSAKIDSDIIDKYKYILVDEFQDLNKLEQEFIEIISKNSEFLLVLGDPNQSIYSFKFAYPEGIKNFAIRKDVENFSLPFSGRCSKKILGIANQILLQLEPNRKDLLKPLDSLKTGETKLNTYNTQEDEFNGVLSSIVKKIENGVRPENIFILVPRKKIGRDFIDFTGKYKLNKKNDLDINFCFSSKFEFSDIEKEQIIKFGLLVNPNSILHLRSYLGLGDSNHYAKEIKILKTKYNNIRNAYESFSINDFNNKSRKFVDLSIRISELKSFIFLYKNEKSINILLDLLFPENDKNLQELHDIFLCLKEESDDMKSLYNKFIDFTHNYQNKSGSVRVLTLMGSKGLEANHVYIIGCNDGNIPGINRSDILNDFEFKQEQRRLLYVGITRAKESLTVCWSRNIPFSQAKEQYTKTIGTLKINRKLYQKVGLSEFLQDINFQ